MIQSSWPIRGATATTVEPDAKPDILGAMRRGKYLIDMHRAMPASFNVCDMDHFTARVKDLTAAKQVNKGVYEYAGITIKQDENLPEGIVEVRDCDGNVLSRHPFD